MLLHSSNFFFHNFLPPAGITTEFFSNIYYWNPVKLLEIYFTILLPPMTGSPGIFDSHTLILLRLQPITVQVFLPQHWFPWHFLLVSLYSGKQWLPVSICFSLQSCVQWFVLCPPFSYGSKKSLNFYLLLGYSGNFPSSLHIELETRSL